MVVKKTLKLKLNARQQTSFPLRPFPLFRGSVPPHLLIKITSPLSPCGRLVSNTTVPPCRPRCLQCQDQNDQRQSALELRVHSLCSHSGTDGRCGGK